jgi:hypothetical protein
MANNIPLANGNSQKVAIGTPFGTGLLRGEGPEVLGILRRSGFLHKAFEVKSRVSAAADISHAKNSNGQSILGENSDNRANESNMLRHMVGSALITSSTNTSTARQIMNNHDKAASTQFAQYEQAWAAAGVDIKRASAVNDISKATTFYRPPSWNSEKGKPDDKFRAMVDTAIDLRNNEIGYSLGSRAKKDASVKDITEIVTNQLVTNGGFVGNFKASTDKSLKYNEVATINVAKISQGQANAINESSAVKQASVNTQSDTQIAQQKNISSTKLRM